MELFRGDLLRSVNERSLSEAGLFIASTANGVAGQMLPQPRVNIASRQDIPLDQVLGTGFALIGYNCDPLESLSSQQLAWWLEIGTRTIAMSPRGEIANEHWVEDAYGEIGRWLNSAEPQLVLVRPDRFCMTAFPIETATDSLQAAQNCLCCPTKQ